MKWWKNGKFKRTVKERRYFDRKNVEKLDSKFENLDVNNSNPISPFKGCNIVDLGVVFQQLQLRGVKLARPHYPWHNVKEKEWLVLQAFCTSAARTAIRWIQAPGDINENTKDGRNAWIYDVNTKFAAGNYEKFLL